MRRRILLILSLLWTATFAGLWIRSHRAIEVFHLFNYNGGSTHLILAEGRTQFIWTDIPYPPDVAPPRWLSYRPEHWWPISIDHSQTHELWGIRGFHIRSSNYSGPYWDFGSGLWWLHGPGPLWCADISFWLPITAGLATLLLILLWMRFRSTRRWPPGHCFACGYDLRATPQLCPECGQSQASSRIPWLPSRRQRLQFSSAFAVIMTLAVLLPNPFKPLAHASGAWRSGKSFTNLAIMEAGLETWDLQFELKAGDARTTTYIFTPFPFQPPAEPKYDRSEGSWEVDGDLLIFKYRDNSADEILNAWIRGDRLILAHWPETNELLVPFNRIAAPPTTAPAK